MQRKTNIATSKHKRVNTKARKVHRRAKHTCTNTYKQTHMDRQTHTHAHTHTHMEVQAREEVAKEAAKGNRV